MGNFSVASIGELARLVIEKTGDLFPLFRVARSVTDLDRQRIAACIGDAFGVLCARVGGSSTAEANLRLGFESILRQLGTPPLRLVSKSAPLRYRRGVATEGEIRQILKALEASLAIFERYASAMSPDERGIQGVVSATRDFADEMLAERKRVPDMALV